MTAGTGTLAITVSGVNSCGAGQSFSLANVTVTPAPLASFTESLHAVTVGHNVSVVFTGSAPAGTTYSWDFTGGAASPGTGAGPQVVDWTSDGTKVVTLTLDNGGCLSTVTDSVVVTKSTGINNVSAAINAINVIPNPTSGQANLVLEANTETTISADLYDMAGRMVSNLFSGTLEVGKKSIAFSTDNITSGVYLIKVNNGQTVIQTRFVKL